MNSMEIVHDGWLIKSPPEKRIWKAKWRRRWFTLRHSGQLPGQFILEYYTDTTKRKLKGKIDLDQCEQVDAGLTFESRKSNLMYQYMFDIRTPKRTYYLVAETEFEMTRWVESICSVCGLKIHVEDDFVSSVQQPLSSSENNDNNNSIVSTAANVKTDDNYNANYNEEIAESPSGQYIYISECVTGRPISSGSNQQRVIREVSKDSDGSMPDEPPPPPPKSTMERLVSGEFYDYPRPLQPIGNNFSDDFSTSCDMSGRGSSVRSSGSSSVIRDSFGCLPHVNWNTYPNDGAVFSAEMPQIPEYHPQSRNKAHNTDDVVAQVERRGVGDSGFETRPSQDQILVDCSVDFMPPPRPPKPHNLGENRSYENMNVAGSFNNDAPEELSPDLKVPPPSINSFGSNDDMYDFPRPLHEGTVDIIGMTPPAPSSASRGPRRHAYTNAPAGFIDDENNIFRYDLKSTSMAMNQSYLSMDNQVGTNELLYTDMSGDSQSTASLTPTTPGAVYCNVSPSSMGNIVITDIPPAINRNLKPRKNVVANDPKGSSNLLTLAPPPACRIKSDTQQSYRKPMRVVPSPLPSSGSHHSCSHRLRNSDQSTSDDEQSSISDSPRNSAIESELKSSPFKKNNSEIQYLDLDLDSETGQATEVKSPKTPDKSSSWSTVYKTVDFIKTKAFNETRQNVETYRKKSQVK